MDKVIAQGDDGSADAAAGNDFVAGFQLPQHGLPFFLASLLGHDQQQVENGKNGDQREEPQGAHRSILGL